MAEPISNRLKLFVSYSRKDMETAYQFVEQLETEGFEVTIDRRDLPYGEEWQAELADFIRAADTVVWLVSPASVASKWCNWELGEVQRLNKRLVPVMISAVPPDDLPESLGRIHILPAEGVFDPDQHFDTLVTALNTDRGWLKEHTRLGDRARQWHAKGARGDLLLRGSALNDAESWRDKQPKAAPQPSDDILDLILASRRAHGRRQRITVAASLAIALVAIALSGVALWQRNEAQLNEARAVEQEQIAEQRAIEAEAARQQAQNALDQATETANGIVFNLAQRFKQLGVPTSVLTDILGQARALQDALAEHAADDPELLRSRAAALGELGDMLLVRGDGAAALEAYEEALAISRDIATQDPDTPEWKRDIALALEEIGVARFMMGDTENALDSHQDSLAIRRALVRQEPENALWLGDISMSLYRIGEIHFRVDDMEPALEAFEESLAIRRDLATGDRENAVWQRDVAVVLQSIGDVHLKNGDAPQALEIYDEALAIARDLAARDPNNTEWSRGVSVGLDKVGSARLGAGDARGALQAYEDALAIARDLSMRDPTNIQWQRDVSVGLSKVGDARLRAGDAQGALQAYEEALSISRDLSRLYSENPEWRRDLVRSLFKAALASVDEMQLRYLREALQIVQAMDTEGVLSADQQGWPGIIERALARNLGNAAFHALLDRDFVEAEQASRAALAHDPNGIWININLAHALMFRDRIEDADALYMRFRGRPLPAQNGKLWEEVVLADFEVLREAGLDHPYMAVVETVFAEGAATE